MGHGLKKSSAQEAAAMPDVHVEIELTDPKDAWLPGERLTGRYRLEGEDAPEIERLEVSVLWYTSGKGDEDLGVHFYEERRADSPNWFNSREWASFECTLPQTPQSYDGVLIKIHWCVRVRYYPIGGKQILGECPFQLGTVQPGRKVEA